MNNITGSTRLICLLGNPVAHSKSPAMHNLAFELLGLDYSYLAFKVDIDNMEKVVDALRLIDARGWNITMPCKNKMYELCDKLSDAASIIGAVNCVVNDNGVLTGYNTDGYGFLKSAEEYGYKVSGSKAVLFGCGGTASSILVQLALDGAGCIDVFARKTSKHYKDTINIIDKLIAKKKCNINIYEYDSIQLKESLKDADILINATNVGMEPNTDACLVPDETYFNKRLIVGDAIYFPEKTKLIKMAEKAGLKAFNGKGMLLYQGAESFRLWTGLDMPVEEVRKLL